jgi:hypothetical protein
MGHSGIEKLTMKALLRALVMRKLSLKVSGCESCGIYNCVPYVPHPILFVRFTFGANVMGRL